MVDFRPFRGVLPRLNKSEDIADRVSPPYDIISAEEQAKLQSKPFNITRITLGGVDGRYDHAAALLDSWLSSGKLAQDAEECYYLYRQSFKDGDGWLTRNGIIGVLRSEGYEAGNIIPHEETFPKVKEDRLNLLRSTATHCESIFGLFDRSEIDLDEVGRNAEALFECVDPSGTRHQLLRISDRAAVDGIRSMMSGKKVLIADGHHRYETSYKYSQENSGDERKAFVLCTMVSSQDTGMFVRPTHRLIRNLRFQEQGLLDSMAKQFSIRQVKDARAAEAIMDAAAGPTFGLLFPSGKAVVAEFSAPAGDILWSVDTYVCQEVILKGILYAMPKGNELEVEYDHDASSVESKVRSGKGDLAILVRAPTLDMTWKVAQSGRKMPKKTTYFWPKIWSGFVVYRMK
ncbi:MAG: DUF1015 domain-containing protein [Methanomassiliicoccus sp.]|nr:DUF1015 domain-containing protein [Methanomassiliicoccus sp.]